MNALVRRQIDVGLDLASDGELSKNSFSNYVTRRLGPLDGVREGGLAALVDAAVPADRRLPAEPSALPAMAVGQVAFSLPSDHYTTEEAWLEATAETMADEYRAMAATGITVQIDSPDFVMMRHRQYRSATITWLELEALVEGARLASDRLF